MRTRRYLQSVRDALPETARDYLDRALAGDALAARRLMIVAPRRLRGHIACLGYQLNTSNPAYREIVKAVWASETRRLLTDFWRPQMVRRMLERADVRIPEFGGPVTVFRPFSGASVRKAAAELSWWLSLEAAMSEAIRLSTARPRLLQATVDPADIVYWGKCCGEQEIVLRGRPAHAVVVEPASLIRPAPQFIAERK